MDEKFVVVVGQMLVEMGYLKDRVVLLVYRMLNPCFVVMRLKSGWWGYSR